MHLPDSVIALTQGPHASAIVTRDERMRPQVHVAGFATIADDREHVTMFVMDRPGRDVRAALTANGRVALTLGHPVSCENYQLKGSVTDVRAMSEPEIAHQDAMYAQLVQLYSEMFPPEVVQMLQVSGFRPCLAVTFKVDALFAQTPGPGAGEAMTSKAAEATT